MQVLLITEKCSQDSTQLDGGARLVTTIKNALGESVKIMQFGNDASPMANWHFQYPYKTKNRFEQRIKNAAFIIEQIKKIEDCFTNIIFVHISMQFGIGKNPLKENLKTWTFPMFLTPSYIASGEIVPEEYTAMEKIALEKTHNIITPSYLEKRQLTELYSIPEDKIYVIPRGVNNKFIRPKARTIDKAPKFCSIGSIKPQKDTIGLIQLFTKINERFPEATLKIIGPVQNNEYYIEVINEIKKLSLTRIIEFTGYIPPDKIAVTLSDSHIHLSTSKCETFGRAMFETLALGLPNIARKTENAAVEYLMNFPYAKFADNDDEMLSMLEIIVADFTELSAMALEISKLYADEKLAKLLVAKVCNKAPIVISDFDGTIFHKDDLVKTKQCIEAFKQFSVKIICSARPIAYLLEMLAYYKIKVDWIISYSGAVVTDGAGNLLWTTPLTYEDIGLLKKSIGDIEFIKYDNKIIQAIIPANLMAEYLTLQIETYQGLIFVNNLEATKLRAIHKLLDHISWDGQVRVFGDGPYDHELITYFDGTIITDNRVTSNVKQKSRITYG